MGEQMPEEPLRRVPVEVSPWADQYHNAWKGVWESQELFRLANASLLELHVQLDPIYRGRDMESPEVRGLLDSDGIAHEPDWQWPEDEGGERG